ncbi:MAG: hypothetical protein EXS27_05895 [Pedosphaera sp.]|nr:hypothetical protein [Pedosphaera sp.]
MSTLRRERLLLWLSLGANVLLLLAFVGFLGKWKLMEVQLARERRNGEELMVRIEEAESPAKARYAPKPALTDSEVLELARLRSEVTRLRNDQRTATNAPAARRAVPAAVAPPAVGPPPTDVVIFSNSVSAVLPLGHSLALGGWAEPGTGRSILGFVTPETTPDAPGSVMVQMRLMSVPDALLDRLGLQRLRAELPPGQPPRFDAAQIATLLKAMEQSEGVDILSMPRVITSSGQQAQVAVLNEREGGPTTGPVITLTPTLDASGTSVRLDVGVELKLLPQRPQP